MKMPKNRYQFKAEVKQLLNILVHSLYSHKDVFIRELISNSSDALDKIKFLKLKGEEDIQDENLDFEINITLDKDKKKITIADTGLGMTKDEIMKNIGTIAHSGTGAFLQKLSEEDKKSDKDVAELIGRFGVGFYAVFMTAKEVILTTKSYLPGEKSYTWKSDGAATYELVEGPEDFKRGTQIEIFLRDDEETFAEKWKIENAIRKYSNFVNYPIKIDGEQFNKISAIWREPKSSLKKEDYNEFYKFLSNREEEPLTHLHISAEMPMQFNSIMFVPETNDEVFGFRKEEYGLNLFSRRVLIQNEHKDIIPEYLRFIKGVVDTEDLPLNISRETLQENDVIFKIRNVLVSKLLAHLEDLAKNDSEKYATFWQQFGRIFKEGHNDFANQEKFASLLRFNSSADSDATGLTALADYVARMKEEQTEIYYFSAPSRAAAEMDPHLEMFRQKDLEVLYLYNPIDEFVLSTLNKFQDKDLVSADQAKIDTLKKIAGKEDEAKDGEKDQDKAKVGDLLKRIKEILGDRVEDVRLSERLTTSPAVLVSKDGGMSGQMEKLYSMMAENKQPPKKVLEVNGNHSILQNLNKVFEKDAADGFIEKVTLQLFESALLLDGYLQDPHQLVNRMQDLVSTASELYADQKNA
jgi:molecular chaperone HtpG